MTRFYFLVLLSISQNLSAQIKPINRKLFFTDDKVIEATLTTDVKKLRNDKKVPAWQPAKVALRFEDSALINEEIRVKPRGDFRKNNCDLASLMFNFKGPASPVLSPLKKLKMVGGCRTGSVFEELLLKEYLTYKIYNLLTIMSFNVRLLHLSYIDSRQKAKTYSQYAFLLEDIGDMGERNNCKEVKNLEFSSEATNRKNMTLVALFQYMIGNTDWSVLKNHNIKLVKPLNDSLAAPYAIAYDFDYAGIVDAGYAVPNEELGIKSVKERLYRGFSRTMDELMEAIDIFKEKKSRIYFTINNFSLLSGRTRKGMIDYLDDFYKTIDDKRTIRNAFIANAREQ